MANIYTVGIEIQSSAAQQAIAQLERSFQGMSASASAAQQASMALGQGLGQAGQAANGAANEYQNLSQQTEHLAGRQAAYTVGLMEATNAFKAVANSAKQYVQAAIQVGQATQGAIAANTTLSNDAAGLDKTFQQLTKNLNYQTNSLELNKAAYDVLSAGITKTADITQVMEAGVKGAKGGFSDLGTITDATTTIMNAFHKGAGEANKIVDQMIQTQNDGKIVAREYGHQIGVVASGAASAGVSLEELNAAVGIATVAGVQVSSTFTGLRQAISAIVSPSEQAKKIAKELGIEFSQNAIKSKGFAGVLKDVAEATKGNADQITKLFGSVEAKAVLDPILNDLPKYNQFLENQTKIAGQAAAASDKVTKGLAAQQGALANIAVEINRKVFDTLEPALAAAAGMAFNLAKEFTDLPEPIQKVVIGLGLFTAAVVTASAAVLAFKLLGLTTTAVMGALGTAIAVITGPIGLTAAAIAGAYLVFKQIWDSSEKLRESVGRLGTAFGRFFSAFSSGTSNGSKSSKSFTDTIIGGFKVAGDTVAKFVDYATGAIDVYTQFIEDNIGKIRRFGRELKESFDIATNATLFAIESKLLGPVRAYHNLQNRLLDERLAKQRRIQELNMLDNPVTAKTPVNSIVPTQGVIAANPVVKEDEKIQKEREKLEKKYQDDKLRYEKELRDRKLQNERDLADKRKTEFEKARDKERRAWEDTRSFENGMFDLKKSQEQKLFDLKRRNQDLLLQRELQGQSEIVRAVINAHNEGKQVDKNSSASEMQYKADMEGFRRQKQQLLDQQKRDEIEADKVRAFNQKQFISVPKERPVAPTLQQPKPDKAVTQSGLSYQSAIANFGQATVMDLAKQYGLNAHHGRGNHFGSNRTNSRNPGSLHRSGDAVDFGDRMQGVSIREAHGKFSNLVNELIRTGAVIHVDEIIWNGHGSPLGDYFATGGKGPFFKIENGQKKRITNMGVVRGHTDHLHIGERNEGGDRFGVQVAAKPQGQPVSYASSNEKTVKASFYGGPTDRKWHGRKTASGEVYDENGLTVAVPYVSRTDKRPSIPFGTVLEVRGPNGKKVQVTVTDTGNFGTDPKYGGRGLDLSYGAAKALGIVQAGVATVSYSVVNPNEKAYALANRSKTEMPKAPVIDYTKTPYGQVNVPTVRDTANEIKLVDKQMEARKVLFKAEQENARLERENAALEKGRLGVDIINQKTTGLRETTQELKAQAVLMGLEGDERDKMTSVLEAQKQLMTEITDLQSYAKELEKTNPNDPRLATVKTLIGQLNDALNKYQAEVFAQIKLRNAIAATQSGFDSVDRDVEAAIRTNQELNNQLALMQLKGDEQSQYQAQLEAEKASKEVILSIEENIAALRKSNPNSPYIAPLEAQLDRVRGKAAELEFIYTSNNSVNKAIADMDGFQKYQEGLKTASYDVAVLSNQSDQAARMAENMGNAFGDAFTRFATGADSAQNAGVNFLTGLSNAFANEVQRMLAIAATSQLLPLLSGMFGGGGSQAQSLFSTVATGLTGFNTGGDFSIDSGTTLPGFTFTGPMLAEGGIVSKPTIAMIGEGSEPEAVIPLSKLNRGGSPTTINAPVNVTVNNDGSVKVESNQAGELGKVIQQAVVNELVRQQRPGGLIARR